MPDENVSSRTPRDLKPPEAPVVNQGTPPVPSESTGTSSVEPAASYDPAKDPLAADVDPVEDVKVKGINDVNSISTAAGFYDFSDADTLNVDLHAAQLLVESGYAEVVE